MVLEGLINPKIDHVNSLKFFLVGMLYTLVGSGIALFVFPGQSSIVSVFMIVLACAPFVYHMLEREEVKELNIHTTKGLFAEYGKIIKVLLALFLGMVAMFIILASNFPDSQLFTLQTAHLDSAVKATPAHFEGILTNNLTVLLVCVMFSFFFSMGAIFILAWNASVVGAAIGYGISQATGPFSIFVEIVRILPHGIIEFAAYFIAGVGGSFVSFGMLHKEFLTNKFESTLRHGLLLFGISIALIVIGAIVEVFLVL